MFISVEWTFDDLRQRYSTPVQNHILQPLLNSVTFFHIAPLFKTIHSNLCWRVLRFSIFHKATSAEQCYDFPYSTPVQNHTQQPLLNSVTFYHIPLSNLCWTVLWFSIFHTCSKPYPATSVKQCYVLPYSTKQPLLNSVTIFHIPPLFKTIPRNLCWTVLRFTIFH